MSYNNALDMMRDKQHIATQIYAYDVTRVPSMSSIQDKYIQDAVFTVKFLSIALDVEEPLIFINYMNWFGQLAYYLHFNLKTMKSHFEACHHVFNETLSPDFYQVLHHTFDLGIKEFERSFLATKPNQIEMDQFLDYLIQMDDDQAYQFVQLKIEEGYTLKEIYLDLLQPTLYKVGDLWQQRIITVAKEHYITAAIQHIIGKLYPLLFTNKGNASHSMTAVCAGDELHEIGMRMIADFFELSGWDSHFLGSNIPVQLIVEHLMEHPTDILAISATTSSFLIDVKNLIKTIKNHPTLNTIKIIVGGKVFNETPNLWKSLGADAYALNPEQAILFANILVGESHA